MTIESVKTALAAIEAAIIPGSGHSYATAPASLPPGDLPIFINLTGPATVDWSRGGSDKGVETRQYTIMLFVDRVGQGLWGEREARAEDLIQQTRDAFAAHPHLGGVARVMSSEYVSDSGITVLNYGNEEYIGIEFVVRVTEWIPRVYGDNE